MATHYKKFLQILKCIKVSSVIAKVKKPTRSAARAHGKQRKRFQTAGGCTTRWSTDPAATQKLCSFPGGPGSRCTAQTAALRPRALLPAAASSATATRNNQSRGRETRGEKGFLTLTLRRDAPPRWRNLPQVPCGDLGGLWEQEVRSAHSAHVTRRRSSLLLEEQVPSLLPRVPRLLPPQRFGNHSSAAPFAFPPLALFPI